MLYPMNQEYEGSDVYRITWDDARVGFPWNRSRRTGFRSDHAERGNRDDVPSAPSAERRGVRDELIHEISRQQEKVVGWNCAKVASTNNRKSVAGVELSLFRKRVVRHILEHVAPQAAVIEQHVPFC